MNKQKEGAHFAVYRLSSVLLTLWLCGNKLVYIPWLIVTHYVMSRKHIQFAHFASDD
jgi:hypothetical protein